MKVVVLGSTGMLGQALRKEADNRGIQTIGIARSRADISLDIADCCKLAEVIADIRPSIIINTAAITDLLACESDPCAAYVVNSRPVAVLAKIAEQIGAYFVQISTDHYFSGDGNAKHTESSLVTLLNEYARTKFAAECFASTYTDALVVRTNIVGFRYNEVKPTFAEWVFRTLKESTPITLFSDFFTSSIHVTQFSTALFDIVNRKPTGVLNLAGADVASKKTFIEAIAARLGYKFHNMRIGSVTELTGAVRAESLGLDVTKAEGILGYSLPGFDDVIDTLVEEYREGSN